MRKYDHRVVEKKWQSRWEKAKLYKTSDTTKGKKNFYLLVEFPYPSGNLHVGHWYAFSVPDILARASRMQGKNVLYPMGFDAFGLPAENAAIKNKLNPRTWTEGNIAYMKNQIRSMGASFDWSREIRTCDPAYYKWTQWQFLQFFKKGLAYQKETPVNWCPKDKTVLANEQVIDGHCDRCGAEVVQKHMLQWNLKITEYADRLIDDLAALDWPEQIKESQRNWIGRSEGAEIDFPLEFEKKDGPKPNYLILHGYKSTAEGAFIPWLKRELESRGLQVQVPQLPNPNEPKEKEQVAHVINTSTIDERTIIVGHSLGGGIALKVLEKANRKVAGLVLVGSVVDAKFPGAEEKPFWKHFNWDTAYERIKKLTGFSIVISDLQEGSPRVPYLKFLAGKLDARLIEGNANVEHFRGKEEPMVLSALLPAITVFTTRADTLFGATYVVLAPEHPWITQLLASSFELLENTKEVEAYVEQAKRKTELERLANQKEKTGVRLEGIEAMNPATGQKIPIFIADYVLAQYGTGAIMAVPAHDERDFEFAKKFEQPIVEVVTPTGAHVNSEGAYTGEGILANSQGFDGVASGEARKAMTAKFGRMKTSYKLRDWIVSRQRYWGVPIPIVHCKACGPQAVPDKDLPVKLPAVEDYLPDGRGKSPLAKAIKWVSVKCPKCKDKAERETDTLDTFVDSSWYFLRYTDPKNNKKFADPKKMNRWMPVNFYSGGPEHTTMHVLYSRFWQKALHDLGFVKDSEPYRRRMSHGLILGPDSQKMSKSHGNVIDPDDIVRNLGADTLRLYLAFIGPYNEVASYPWNPNGVVGVRRFLERVWKMGQQTVNSEQKTENAIENLLHKTIKKVGDDISLLKFNTAISALMIFLNAAEKEQKIGKKQWEIFLRLLAPFTPHMAEELWHQAGNKRSIHAEKWPSYDVAKLRDETVTIAVQIHGKTRGQATVPTGADKALLEKAAREAVASRLAGKEIIRTIVVPGRLVNFVIDE